MIVEFRSQPHDVGDLVRYDGSVWVVLTVTSRLTPYRKRNQPMRVEGHTYGLRRCPLWPDVVEV